MRKAVVLIVEDDSALRDALGEAIERHGHTVLLAASGEEACDLLQNSRVDIVFMELSMPAMSGKTLFHIIISKWPAMRSRVSVLTGDPEAEKNDPWLRLYRLPVVRKPLRLAEILNLIEMLSVDGLLEANGDL
jgi:DNA-binding response OmpR family regulator